MIGLVGKKVGMTRIFTEDGVSIPVTVIEIKQTALLRSKSGKRRLPRCSGYYW